MKRGQTNLNFLLAINKPSGMTSHDVVNAVRKITGEGRVGHMGTLDPLASGVMLLGVGSATRLNQYLENHDKIYIATIEFGKTTNTYDNEGQIIDTFEIPNKISDIKFANNYVDNLVGKHMQMPPSFSAIKVEGRPAYKAARQGKEINLEEREIEIYEASLIKASKYRWVIKLCVSSGTYIRSIANDIGADIGCGAILSSLSRESLGDVDCSECYSIEDFEFAFKNNSYKVLNAAELLRFPIVEADEKMLKRISNGRSLGMDANWNLFPGSKVSLISESKLLAIYRADTLIDLNCECKFASAISLE